MKRLSGCANKINKVSRKRKPNSNDVLPIKCIGLCWMISVNMKKRKMSNRWKNKYSRQKDLSGRKEFEMKKILYEYM